MLSERISRLREQSLNATPRISLERARLLTEFYRSGLPDRFPIPVARGMALKHILENKTICVNDGELIVGERGEEPKATPTYPEICTHSSDDFNVLDSREKVWFRVAEEDHATQQEEIAPFWKGRSIRDRLFAEMDREWIDAYEAGVFTEFQEQRAPGHTVLDDKIYRKGFRQFKEDIQAALDKLDFYTDRDALSKRDQLRGMQIAAEAIITYAQRHAEVLKQKAENEPDASRKSELLEMAQVCEKVPAEAPDTLWEALQYYWFVHLGVITELNTWDSFNPGRLDQHLLSFYKRDVEQGRLTPESARELLQSFWVKFNNQPAPPKVGVTAQESNTYTDFCLINLGGLTSDGEDASNEMSYILLDVIEQMRLLQPSSMVQISKKNPDKLLRRALDIIKTGYGQPSLFNTDAIVQELVRQGKSVQDARNGGASGCVEAGAFGKESYILTGYFNIPKVLELTLHNGVDPRTGKQLGPKTGNPADFSDFDQLYEAFNAQLEYFVNVKVKGNLTIERLWATILPCPFLSILIDDCITSGKDYNDGGARYNSSYIQGVGLGSVTDSLVALKYHLFDKRTYQAAQIIEAMASNFDGQEEMRRILLDETPRYGNDDDYADDIMRRVFESYFSLVDGRPNTKGGHFRVNLLPTTCHIYFGSVIGGMPDGRLCGEPLSEGVSPVQGADRHGPTSVIKSAAKIDHIRTGGTLLNQKFSPQLLQDEDGLTKVAQLVRTYFRMDGHHIQFNVVTADTLRKAQAEPEKHRDLIVRVAGYSDYFVDLGLDLQNEIIHRTEHSL